MAKKIHDKALDSRAARAKLKDRGRPYWAKALGRGVHLGYRKGKAGGVWVMRRYLGNQTYKLKTIGQTDDTLDADGVTVLDYWQAQAKVTGTVSVDSAKSNSYTLRQAMDAYLISIEGKPTQPKAKQNFAAYVPAELADKPVEDITAGELEALQRSIVKLPPRAHTTPGKKQNYWTVDMSDSEIQRKRKATTNRIMTSIMAALNLAFREGRVASDAAWRRVKHYKGANAARIHYLSIAEAKRLINACEPDFRTLVRAALQTGARYQELARLTVADFNPDSGTLHVRRSKSGRDRHIVLTEEGAELFASLAAGKSGRALLLGREWKELHQVRPMKLACERAKLDPPISFHGLRHTWASLAVMGGMPLPVVARNLGHVNTTMVERHYGHLAPSYITEAVRKHAPRFGSNKSNVKAIRG